MIENINWQRDYSYMSDPFRAPPAAPSQASPTDPSAPSTLDPNYWALQIMGMLGYYHMLSNRDASVQAGSAEDAWLKGQMANCVTFLQNAQAAEAAYEKANPGQTYLASAFCDILKQSTTETGTSGFNKWWLDNLQQLDGIPGYSIMDWFNATINVENPLPSPGQSQSDLMGVAFASTMLFVDLDNTTLGQAGGIDGYFNDFNPVRPSHLSMFALLAPEMLTSYLWTESGSPNPSDPGWSSFAANVGYLGNMLNPANLPTPTPANYQTYFWDTTSLQTPPDSYGFSYALSQIAQGKFPNGNTDFSTTLNDFLQAFDDKFIK
jgi:hypothetical protein